MLEAAQSLQLSILGNKKIIDHLNTVIVEKLLSIYSFFWAYPGFHIFRHLIVL